MNGYSYNGGYEADRMDQGEDGGGGNVMSMRQDGMTSNGYGGQSLDEIVHQNANAIRRQSLPHQYGGSSHTMDPNMRRMTMMDYGGTSPVGQMGNFQDDSNTQMVQDGMMSDHGNVARGNNRSNQNDRRQSQHELSVNTAFANASQNYGGMMSNSAYQSPTNPSSAFEMPLESPYVDSGLAMQMEYNLNQDLVGAGGGNVSHMNAYSQPQFHHQMMTSPLPRTGSQGTPRSGPGQSQEAQISGGMNTQYSGHSGSADNTRQPSRRSSLQVRDDVSSPAPLSGGFTPMNQPASRNSQPPTYSSFHAQPQHPQPGSAEDRGMGNASRRYDGVNGPIQVDNLSYNPNNQGFNWEVPEGGWPSTMVNKPHMQTSHKNAYSSTGFDMLNVLVWIRFPTV